MSEQATQFNPEQLTPEEIQMIREQRARQEQLQATEFADEMQKQAESRFKPSSNIPDQEKNVPVDIPGITREHKPLAPEGGIFSDGVSGLNRSLENSVDKIEAVLLQRLNETADLDASDTIEKLAALSDLSSKN